MVSGNHCDRSKVVDLVGHRNGLSVPRVANEPLKGKPLTLRPRKTLITFADTFHQCCHARSKLSAELFVRHWGVFERIVEDAGNHDFVVEAVPCKQNPNSSQMADIGHLDAWILAKLVPMPDRRMVKGPLQGRCHATTIHGLMTEALL